MHDLLRDVVMAGRRLRAAPAFTTFSVITLALGIGATTAIFGIIHGTLLRPPQIRDIDRVVNLYHSYPFGAPGLSSIALSMPDYLDLSRTQTSFEQMVAWRRVRAALTSDNLSELVSGELVAGPYFSLVGARPRLGRTLQPSDDDLAAAPVMVISEGFWRRRFDSDSSVVGQVVAVNGRAVEIVGVIASPFQGVDMPNILPTRVWMPSSLGVAPDRAGDLERTLDREARVWLVKARLRPGVSVEQANAEVVAIAGRLDRAHPIGDAADARARRDPRDVRRSWHLIPAAGVLVHETVHPFVAPLSMTLAVMVLLVLLVTATNLANLLLARGAQRRHEIAVRAAVGGSRARLIREQLIESAIVAAAAGVASVGIARLATRLVSESAVRLGPGVLMELTPTADLSAVVAAAALTLVTFLIFGGAPAVRLTSRDLLPPLQGADLVGAAPRWRGRRLLIAAQVSISAALVGIAMFSVQQVARSSQRDTGIALEQLAAVAVDFGLAGYDEMRARDVLRRLHDVAQRDDRSQRAALASGLPVGLSGVGAALTLPGDERRTDSALLAATPEIFDVLGLSMQRGRAFTEADHANGQRVAVVSERTARTLFGTPDAVGRALVLSRRQQVGEDAPTPETLVIVGVVSDTDVGTLGRRDRAVVYVPFSQHYESRMAVVVRSADASATAASLPELVRRVDSRITVTDVGTGVSLTGIANVPMQVAAGLTGLLGLLTLGLAMSGLYGVLSLVVTGRRREIGVRRALGATTESVLRLILGSGLQPVVSGTIAGLVVSGTVRVAVARVLPAVPAAEPWVIAAVPLLFMAAGVLACVVPARRATRVDPSVALREL